MLGPSISKPSFICSYFIWNTGLGLCPFAIPSHPVESGNECGTGGGGRVMEKRTMCLERQTLTHSVLMVRLCITICGRLWETETQRSTNLPWGHTANECLSRDSLSTVLLHIRAWTLHTYTILSELIPPSLRLQLQTSLIPLKKGADCPTQSHTQVDSVGSFCFCS